MNLIKAQVQIEDGTIFDALVDLDNETWNGWINPYFDQVQRDKFIKEQESCDDEEFIQGIKSIESEKINGKDYYYFGSCYIWSYVEKPLIDLSKVVSDCEFAIGEILIKHMPKTESGDIDPCSAIALEQAIESNVRQWWIYNASPNYNLKDGKEILKEEDYEVDY